MKANDESGHVKNVAALGEFWPINKVLARKIGHIPALLLSDLIRLRQYLLETHQIRSGDSFYYKADSIEETLHISERERIFAQKTLVKYGLTQVAKTGIPAKNYYTINDEKLAEIVESHDKLPQNAGTSDCDTQQGASTIRSHPPISLKKDKNKDTQQRASGVSSLIPASPGGEPEGAKINTVSDLDQNLPLENEGTIETPAPSTKVGHDQPSSFDQIIAGMVKRIRSPAMDYAEKFGFIPPELVDLLDQELVEFNLTHAALITRVESLLRTKVSEKQVGLLHIALEKAVVGSGERIAAKREKAEQEAEMAEARRTATHADLDEVIQRGWACVEPLRKLIDGRLTFGELRRMMNDRVCADRAMDNFMTEAEIANNAEIDRRLARKASGPNA